MATTNPFDLLGDDDQGDLSQLIAAQQLKLAAEPKKAAAPVKVGAAKSDAPGKLPSKPLPPAQAVREARDGPRGRGRGGGRGFGPRRGGGSNGDYGNNENSFSNNGYSGGYKPTEDGEKATERRPYGAPRSGGFRGGRRGGFSNDGDAEGERPRRVYERHSGTGRSNDFKREGSGRGNWGTPNDEITPEAGEVFVEKEKVVSAENQAGQEDTADASKDIPVNEPEEKEPEDNEMTLEEYEKVLEEKRKALLSEKTTEGRKVEDKDFESMQLLSSKKTDEEIFAKLGSDKDKRKEPAEKEEKVKKSVSINEFLKPAEGQRSGGRGRGRGRGGPRGGFNGGNFTHHVPAPAIDDAFQFPSLSAK